MKIKVSLSSVLLMLMLGLVGCSSPGPSDTVRNYYAALFAGEVDEAVSYLSASSLQSMGGEEAWREIFTEMAIEAQSDVEFWPEIEVVDETINGDVAIVVLNVKPKNGLNQTQEQQSLVKENGNWKLNIDIWGK